MSMNVCRPRTKLSGIGIGGVFFADDANWSAATAANRTSASRFTIAMLALGFRLAVEKWRYRTVTLPRHRRLSAKYAPCPKIGAK